MTCRAWGRALVGLGVIAGFAATRPAPVLSAQKPSDLERWLDAVDRHRPGLGDAATSEIDPWSPADLMDGVVSRVRRALAEPARSGVLKRGAMLHADIAMIRVLNGQFVTSSRRGVPLRASYQTHLEIARQLLDWVEPDPRRDPDVRLWYRAVTAWLHHYYLVYDLQAHLSRARAIFRDDASTAFDSGTAAQALAAAAIQNTLIRQVITPSTTFVIRSPQTHLGEAEQYFRRALALDSEMVEAHVRLGHVLDALGRTDTALEHLERARTSATDPVLLYYTHLLSGRALERHDDAGTAVDAYERARALYPFAQSPLLSLARLADVAGDRAGARVLADRVLDLPWSDRQRDDPWWTYHLGIGRDAARLVDRLHARVSALPRAARSGVEGLPH